MTDLATTLANATMRAAVDIIIRRQIDRATLDLDALTLALRREVLAGYDTLVAEMADAQFMGEAMLSAILSATATMMAIAALKSMGVL